MSKVFFNGREVVDIEMEDIDMRDYPDFCDAYVMCAWYKDGDTFTELTQQELEKLTEEQGHDLAHDQIC